MSELYIPIERPTRNLVNGRFLKGHTPHNKIDMSIKISKEAYEKLIKEDLDFLNEHCPDSLELDHIKVIICSSIDWHYPDKNTCTALKRIENRLKVELQKQKDAGKQFLSDQEIDGLIDSILKEEYPSIQ